MAIEQHTEAFIRGTETPDARHARLDADRSAQQVRRSTETPDARQARLQHDRHRHSQQRVVTSDVPLFEQPAVHSKMLNFHSKLASLEFHNCNVCFEHFPNLVMSTLYIFDFLLLLLYTYLSTIVFP